MYRDVVMCVNSEDLFCIVPSFHKEVKQDKESYIIMIHNSSF